jgi:PAS domain S-box-containing protein
MMVAGYQLTDRPFSAAGALVCRAHRPDDASRAWLIWPDPESSAPYRAAQLRRDFGVLSALDIEGVVRPSGLIGEGEAVVMVVCVGAERCETLDALMNEHRFALSESLVVAIRLTRILGALHARGMPQGRIRPTQILIDPATDEPCWLPLNHAPELSEALEVGKLGLADLAYISPEQTGRINRPIDYRTDFYSLGVLLYRLLTGQLPFSASEPMEWVHSHIARLPRPPSDIAVGVPPVLSRIVMKLLAKAAEDRYQSAFGLQFDLEECLKQLEATGRVVRFPLARKDVSERFRIPDKLYGRETEVALLREAFVRMAESGQTELILIGGYSGIGKSSLVHELDRHVAASQAYFTTGKFDQYRHGVPYATITEAFRDLVRRVLAEPEARLAEWRQTLLDALDGNGRLIIEIIPEIELIIGPQPNVPDLPPSEAENRFRRVFRHFVGAFARPEHPLVFFLDDLQWIDAGTLTLMEELVAHPDTRYLLALGAFRDDGGNNREHGCPEGRIESGVARIESAGAKVQLIKLGPLGRDALERLTANALHCTRARAAPLARLVESKTHGNPFFFIQFLSELHDEGLLRFNRHRRTWTWDLARIEGKAHTDNVAAMMIAKLERLPPLTRQTLQLAACLGGTFEPGTLAPIAEREIADIEADLRSAVNEGLLRYREGCYRFIQDRVQEAAYSLLPEARRPFLHLSIGRLLLAKLSAESTAERVFDVVDHLNRGAELICETPERQRLSTLNALAGRKAKAAIAYRSACAYFAQSATLLPKDVWRDSYAETFALYLDFAESEYLAGDFNAADKLFDCALANAGSDLDRARAWRLRSRLYQTTGRFGEAMSLILQALQLFGIELPGADDEFAAAAEAEMAEIDEQLRGRIIAQLADAPAATDPIGMMIISLLVEALGPAYAAKPKYFPLLAAKSVNYSLRYGHIVESCIAYGAYAIVLVAAPKTTRAGFEFSEMSLSLLDKLGASRQRGLVLVGHGGMICPWLKHIAVGLPFLERGLAALVDAGDFLNAAYSTMFPVWAVFESGKPLDEVLNTAERYATLAREVHNATAHDTVRLCERLLANLGERVPELASFDGGALNEAECLSRFTQAGWDVGIAYYSVIKQITAFMCGRHAEASEAAGIAYAALRYRSPMPVAATLCFYQTLTMTALYPAGAIAEQQALAPALARNLEKYRLWSEHCPANYRNRYELLAAEIARVQGREVDAMHGYEASIAAAREQGFVQYEGLAHELASSFYRTRGFAQFADIYLARARNCYLRWGALAKVRQLDATYPQLGPESPFGPTALQRSGQPLDALAVMKAMRAISAEVVLDRLLDTLMQVVIESAGAQKGCLLLKRGEDMPIVATASVSGSRVEVRASAKAEDGNLDMPSSIFNYVRRTRERVVFDDATVPNRFSADDYLARHRPKSILCLPIQQHAELVGLLYLENGLVTHAFTPDRLVVVELLASQAATSLDNAFLYTDLRQEVSERRRAEDALHASEETLRELVEILPIAVYSCDASGRLESFNRRAVELWGREPKLGDRADRFCGCQRIYEPDGQPTAHADCPVAEALRTGVPQSDREIVIERPDGSRRTVLVSPVPRRNRRGTLTGAINCLVDITERKQAEEGLRENRAMFQSLFESAPDAILVVEAENGEIVRCNRQAEAMFGYTADELRGQRVEVLLPERFRQEHPSYRGGYLADPHPRPMGTRLELHGRRKDGSEFPVDITLGPLETERGRLALSIVRDMSERQQAEAERQARQAAEAASLAKSEFLANMSHELRSPLNTILGFARLMASDPELPTSARDDLDLILKSGEHLYALINQVLDLSKLEAGRATFNEADFDLHLLLDDLRSLFAPAASTKGLQLLFARHRKVPRHVRTDPLKLRQVLINLLDNALKFTRKGGVSVGVSLAASTPTAPNGIAPENGFARLRFTISDSGPGIAPDELKGLFDAFVQTEAGRQAQHGTGLGLTISRGFVRLMGGEMRMESTPGAGTTVSFEIPVRVIAPTSVVGEARFRRVLALAHGQPRYRILVVDDQAEARELLVRLLAPLGFRVQEAADGQAAIDAWRDWRPDLVFLDLAMPGIDGYETCRRIRASSKGQRQVIIAVTAAAGEEQRSAAFAAGCNAVLRKPLREADLFAALEKYLNVKFLYEEEAPTSPRIINSGALSSLPEGQRAALEDALVRLDSDAIERMIDDIRQSDAALAQALAACAKDFQYEDILAALHGEAAQHGGSGTDVENGTAWPAAGAS